MKYLFSYRVNLCLTIYLVYRTQKMLHILFTPGGAAVVVLAHALLTKMMMTLLWRTRFTVLPMPSAEQEKLERSNAYKRWWASQLNEAEWASLLAPCFLYMHLAKVDAPWACALGAAGQVLYFWPRALVGNRGEGGWALPPYLAGAGAGTLALDSLSWRSGRRSKK